MGTTSVPVSLSRALILLGRVPSYLLLLLYNTEPTRALSVVHPPTIQIALIHGTHRDSRVPWLRLVVLIVLLMVLMNARRG